MSYVEHAPHPALARHVECYWTIRRRLPPGEAFTAAVLPDGCMDIIVPLGGRTTSRHGARSAPYAVGTMTRPLRVGYAGDVHLVGVRFRPGGAAPSLDAEAGALTDTTVELSAMWGAAANELQERLAEANATSGRLAILDEVLLARARRAEGRVDEGVLRASELATASAVRGPSVERMARAAALGRRQLERRFLASVGVAPKTFARILRFRAAVALLHAEPALALSALAARAGYADQSHLTREFVALAGTTPARYRRERIAGDAFVQDAGAAVG